MGNTLLRACTPCTDLPERTNEIHAVARDKNSASSEAVVQEEDEFDIDEGGTADHLELAVSWLSDVENPAALVGGAALANFFEVYESTKIDTSDVAWKVLLKIATSFLLVSSFVLELLVIFITAVTATYLLGYTSKQRVINKTPMGLLHDNFKFEYVAIRFCFFQGLLHWLGAIALQVVLLSLGEHEVGMPLLGEHRMQLGIAFGMFGVIIMVLAFHNGHLTFYKNYVHMAQGLVSLTIQRYYTGQWPPRPLPMLALIPFGASIYMMATGLVMVWKKHHVRSQSAVV